jgi:hypothetical protein
MGCGGSKSTATTDSTSKKNKKRKDVLSEAMREVFTEDLELFLSLPNEV